MTVSRPLFKPTREQKKAADPKRSVWVSANAGSGKTHVLVDRLIRLLLDGADPSTVLSITFTQAAAAEMSTRVFARLSGWAILSDGDLQAQLSALGVDPVNDGTVSRARQLFAKALETPGGLKVQTIHAFCQSLLHLFPVEAGMAPGFVVLEEQEARHELEEAWLATLQRMRNDPAGDLATSFNRVEANFNESTLQEALQELLEQPSPLLRRLSEAPDYALARASAFATLQIDPTLNEEQYEQQALAIDASELRFLIDAFAGTNPLGGAKIHVPTLFRRICTETTPDARIRVLREGLFTSDQKPYSKLIGAETRKSNPEAAARLDAFQRLALDLVQSHDACARATLSADMLHIAAHTLSAYRDRKQKRGAFDFNDLIARTADMLGRSSAAQWILYNLDRGIEHILVDEAQDTSDPQWSIILALVDEFFAGKGRDRKADRTLFVVGDQKQSIYSFQGADAALFAKVRGKVSGKVRSKDFSDVRLGLSYRSVPDILRVVDAVFPPKDLKALGITAADGAGEAHEPLRLNQRGVFELWPALPKIEQEDPLPWDAPVDSISPAAPAQRLAREIAQLVKGWIGQRVLATTGKSVGPGDILILLKRRSNLFSWLIAALRQVGVPVAGADRLVLHHSLAVQDLLALAQFTLLPDDDYSLACVLKSPLIAQPFDDDLLFEMGFRRKGTLWSAVSQSPNPKAVAATETLTALRIFAQTATPYAFFAFVLNHRRKAMTTRLGPESVDATHAFLDLALSYQSKNAASVAGFVAWFASGDITIRREMDKPHGEVRIMTVHGAKGLEAPIVILPDATDSESYANRSGFVLSATGVPIVATSKLVDHEVLEAAKAAKRQLETEEYMRLLYVAMTRARDELYVFGTLSGKKVSESSWYGVIEKRLGQQPLRGTRFVDAMFDGERQRVLRIGADPQTELPFSERSSSPDTLLPDWAIPSEQQLARPEPKTMVSADHLSSDDAMWRGTGMHALLQHLADVADDERDAAAERLGSTYKLSLKDRNLILDILSRDDLAMFYGPHSAGEVAIAQGQGDPMRIDRLVVTEGSVIALDYKSGRRAVPLDTGHAYIRQMVRYGDALAEAYPGKTVKAALLWIDSGQLDWIDVTQQ